jgi:hypothetical protein
MRWALVVGAAMAAMALGSVARAHVRTIDLDGCSGGCLASPNEDTPAAKGGASSKITLSRSGSGAAHPNEPSPALVLDRRTAPTGFTSGLPSPLATADAVLGGVSPYDYFEDVIDIPLSAEARAEFAAVPFFLFAPSLLGRLSFTEVLSAGAAFFDRYSPHSPPPPL